jgi:hypothetical protein
MVVIIIAILCLAIRNTAPVESQLWAYASGFMVIGGISAGLLLVTLLSLYSLIQYVIVNRRLFSRGST